MSVFLHILKRMAFVVLGYLVALLVGLVTLVAIYSALSTVPGAPEYFGWVSTTPLLVILVPGVALLAVLVAVAVTAVPMLVAAVITELFSLRALGLHMLFGALVSVGGMGLLVPVDGSGWPAGVGDLGIIAASGLVGGGIYWLIAGREAGLRRRFRAAPYQPVPTPSSPEDSVAGP